MSTHLPLPRTTLPGTTEGPLFYAQLREDAEVELRSLGDVRGKRVAVVGSGGCTALALLAAGAEPVFVVDCNEAQNHMTELKTAAIVHLPHARAVQLIGGWDARAEERLHDYETIREHLSEKARAFWDGERATLTQKGALAVGRAERFVGVVSSLIRFAIHDRDRVERMLHAESLEEQRRLFDQEWNTWRWRALFPLLFNPFVFRSDYVGFGLDADVSERGSAFFDGLDQPTFAEHFRRKLEYALTEMPTRTNYHLHQVFLGRYPKCPEGLPPYLQPAAAERIRDAARHLQIVDADFTSFLGQQPDASIDAFVLSNIGDWMGAREFEALLGAIARTASPGAVVGFRNFLGWTEIPERWRERFVARSADERLIEIDRSGLQRRYLACEVRPPVASEAVSAGPSTSTPVASRPRSPEAAQ